MNQELLSPWIRTRVGARYTWTAVPPGKIARMIRLMMGG